MRIYKKAYTAIRSVKIALILLAYLALFSALATVVPQGRELDFYHNNYPLFIARLITILRFDTFFRYSFFLVPGALFFVNLTACTGNRIYSRLRRDVKKRFGPDIIHIGLLLLIIGGVITLFGRQEGHITLETGDTFQLPGNYELRIKHIDYLQYEDSSPKDWLTTIEVLKGKNRGSTYTVEVNKPFKIGSLRIFQESYSQKDLVTISDKQGQHYTLKVSEGFKAGETIFFFKQRDPSGKALFEEWKEKKYIASITLELQEEIKGYRLEQFSRLQFTGLKIVRDPGYSWVIVSLTLIGLGFALTFGQKIGDNKLLSLPQHL